LSANHGNDLELALKTVEAFAAAGADAIKVQTFRPESLCLNIDNDYFGARKTGQWKGKTLWEIYQEAALPYEWHWKIQQECRRCGVEFFSSPFDLEAVNFLNSMSVPRYKIASMEITDLPLIRAAALKGKPMVISTGLGEASDIQDAIDACVEVGNHNVTLLKCTSNYPATLSDANLLTIPDMARRFGLPVGVSDHTPGFIVPVAAVAMGATFVEKHVVLDKRQKTLDAEFSMDPREFAEMVRHVRDTEASLGSVCYEVSEVDKLRRRSLYVVTDIAKGAVVSVDDFKSLRPGHGAAPDALDSLVGKRARFTLNAGTPVRLSDFEE
jgi:pseudaminic acid synthase